MERLSTSTSVLAFTHKYEESYIAAIKIGPRYAGLPVLILFLKPAHAEHGEWLLGTDGLLSAQQAPEGILLVGDAVQIPGSQLGVSNRRFPSPSLTRAAAQRSNQSSAAESAA
jgi:hypothetical protein